MEKKKESKELMNSTQAAVPAPAQEPEINEADGEPIFHADEEEGEYYA